MSGFSIQQKAHSMCRPQLRPGGTGGLSASATVGRIFTGGQAASATGFPSFNHPAPWAVTHYPDNPHDPFPCEFITPTSLPAVVVLPMCSLQVVDPLSRARLAAQFLSRGPL